MRRENQQIATIVETLEPPDQAQLCAFLEPFVTEHKHRLIERVLAERTRHVTVVLEDIYQPHNASACLRSAECFGVQDVHIIEEGNAYQVNRGIALGATQWLSLFRYGKPAADNTSVCLEGLRARGYRLVATTLREGSMPLTELPLDRPVALLFGSEEPGLTQVAHDLADDTVHIPMVGFTQSFNISVSVALCLYELTGRLRQSELAWQLGENERLALRLEWLLRTATRGHILARRFLRDAGLPLPD